MQGTLGSSVVLAVVIMLATAIYATWQFKKAMTLQETGQFCTNECHRAESRVWITALAFACFMVLSVVLASKVGRDGLPSIIYALPAFSILGVLYTGCLGITLET